ncbi:MAG: hypothetical protein J6X24_09445 [Firmicutes bacterium]|jgi:hypothetical protein|nr:hypothetical protein [Bacillota bacterium]
MLTGIHGFSVFQTGVFRKISSTVFFAPKLRRGRELDAGPEKFFCFVTYGVAGLRPEKERYFMLVYRSKTLI